ncbi:Hypothetical protein, putative [Bodo saltans]|uniref:Uncharacterized protein n=1 Tax=Bodo saltans TaxID=75058 RepID=A0A0S4JKR0_BODSA|nr:Hypothetical protein, putative [Bodo saltans]|eukprot:CUG92106.1 Hypothetical protein, putative [Bodo saltans]
MPSKRRSSRRFPAASSFVKAVEVLATMPRLHRGDSGNCGVGPSRSQSSFHSSSRESSRIISINPLTPQSVHEHSVSVSVSRAEPSAFGPRVTFTDVPSPTIPPITELPAFDSSVKEQEPIEAAAFGFSMRSNSQQYVSHQIRNPLLFGNSLNQNILRSADGTVAAGGGGAQGPNTPAGGAPPTGGRERRERSGGSWVDNANPQVAPRDDVLDDVVADVEHSLAFLKRAEGYTAMRLRAIITMGETEYASTLLQEIYDFEKQFFRAAVELRDSTCNVSQVVTL